MYGPVAARLYEELTGAHLDQVLRAIDAACRVPGRALDVGCGTGALVRHLERRGWDAHGIDRSRDMVRQARRHGPRGRFAVRDAVRCDVGPPNALLTATFDVVNHLGTAAAVRSFLGAASRSLRPGGLLLFDLVTPHDIECHWADYVHFMPRTSWCLIRHGRRVGPCRGELTYEFFVRARGRWSRHREVHRLRTHARGSIVRWMRAAGFDRIRCVDAATLRAPGPTCVRWMFMGRRRNR